MMTCHVLFYRLCQLKRKQRDTLIFYFSTVNRTLSVVRLTLQCGGLTLYEFHPKFWQSFCVQ